MHNSPGGIIHSGIAAVLRQGTRRFVFVGGFAAFTLSFLLFSATDIGTDAFRFLFPLGQQIGMQLRPCLSSATSAEQALCLWGVVPGLLETHGAILVMQAFEHGVVEQRLTSSACHDASHVVGELLYAYTGDAGKALAICTNACHQGCQHGAIGAAFRTEPSAASGGNPLPSAAAMADLCARHNTSIGGYRLCIHGLGHAFMIAQSGDVLTSLANCDALGLTGVSAELCWTGVFMENARNTAGSGHSRAYLRDDDPLFPCTMPQLEEKYLRACYRQVPVKAGQDGFTICRQAPPSWRENCAEGLGIGIAAEISDSPDSIVSYCGRGAGDLRLACLRGAHMYLELGVGGGVSGGDRRLRRYCDALGGEGPVICDSDQAEAGK